MSADEAEYEEIKTNILQTYTDFIKLVESSTYREILGFNDDIQLVQGYIEVVKSQTLLMTFVEKHQ